MRTRFKCLSSLCLSLLLPCSAVATNPVNLPLHWHSKNKLLCFLPDHCPQWISELDLHVTGLQTLLIISEPDQTNNTTLLFNGTIQVSSQVSSASDTSFQSSFDPFTQTSTLVIQAGVTGKFFIQGGTLVGRVPPDPENTITPEVNDASVIMVTDEPALPLFLMKQLPGNSLNHRTRSEARTAVWHVPVNDRYLSRKTAKRPRDSEDLLQEKEPKVRKTDGMGDDYRKKDSRCLKKIKVRQKSAKPPSDDDGGYRGSSEFHKPL